MKMTTIIHRTYSPEEWKRHQRTEGWRTIGLFFQRLLLPPLTIVMVVLGAYGVSVLLGVDDAFLATASDFVKGVFFNA